MRKKSLHARGVAGSLAVICLLCLLTPAVAEDESYLEYFDWRNIDGKDYTTPIRSQEGAGTCWAFGTVGALECKLKICYDNPDWNPDLSEQHLVYDGTAGNATIGYDYLALDFFISTGVVSEAELPYTHTDNPYYPVRDENWPLSEGWEDRVYKITEYTKIVDLSTDNVKYMLRTYGPLVASFFAGINFSNSDFILPPESAPPTSSIDLDDPTGGVDHTACVIGYKNDEDILNGGYWIIKNSWGTEKGYDNGYFYVPYGVLESHQRMYAITGDAIAPIPEPASMVLLSTGFVILFKRRKRTFF